MANNFNWKHLELPNISHGNVCLEKLFNLKNKLWIGKFAKDDVNTNIVVSVCENSRSSSGQIAQEK